VSEMHDGELGTHDAVITRPVSVSGSGPSLPCDRKRSVTGTQKSGRLLVDLPRPPNHKRL